MDLLLGVFLVFAWIGIVILMRVVTTFLHELGHAIPSLIFTKQPVQVFIGSYGDKEGSWKFGLGKLRLFFIPRLTAWNMGMCRHETADLSFGQRIIILLGGPLASVVIGALALWLIVSYQFNEVVFIVVAAFLLSAVWDLFVNLMPSNAGTNALHGNGGALQSDGTQLIALIRQRRLPATYLQLREKLVQEEYQAIIEQVEREIESGQVVTEHLGLAIRAYEATGEYGGALSIYEYLHKRSPLQPADYYPLGELYQKLGNYQEAINCYGEYLHENYTDYIALHARGICYQQMSEHGAAIQEITTSLRYNDQFATGWRDRAYSLMRLNQFEDAASDLDIARQLAPENPRLFLYESMYLESMGNYAAAHTALLKAKELGDDFHGIEFRLSELERRL